MTEAVGRPLRIAAVAETDSYVKWAAALLGTARADGRLIVLDTELVVSDAQLEAALAGTGLPAERVARREYAALADALRGADVVLAASRGPVARVVARVAASLEPRPVIATGLPGISIPATWLALHFRRECDLFILHSHRELRAFGELAAERGIDQRFALATLPFARRVAGGVRPDGTGTDLVFAAQAIVPRERADRERMARILVRAARADPSRLVVLKLRGRPGEHETHRADDAYPDILAGMADVPPNLVTSYEPMARALETAEGLVTVSSTAAIEAAARGVPVIALDAFGVDPSLINVVFARSGLLAGEDDVVARRFRHPDPAWLRDNYFHDPRDDTWEDALEDLVVRRREGALASRPAPRALGGRAREAWDRRIALGNRDRAIAGRIAYLVGAPARRSLRVLRRLTSRSA
ncbi:DUF6716 putative glycosyltransferase [Microbacterium karelineae]|uniref:DUF6716 putative glycosyltransferase n=1 Tax=Microbacterium karelineae TaxID=2654283 RepID=UPI0012E9D98E|nr:DUF6716 putative glycosyltransferase [Microbacterium karelineae]